MSSPYNGQSTNPNVPGVLGESTAGEGVRGISHSLHGGVVGVNDNAQGGQGVYGESTTGEGVRGIGHSKDHGGVVGTNDGGGSGVYGHSVAQAGVWGESDQADGVFGESHSNQHAGVTGRNKAGGLAGFFDGNLLVTGELRGPQVTALQQQVTALQQQVASLQKLVNDIRLQEISDANAAKAAEANLSGRIAFLGG